MLILSLLLGCPTPEGCQVSDTPVAWMGVGEESFETLVDGDEVGIIYGTQGGYHMPLAFEGEGLAIEELVVANLSGFVDGVEVAHTEPWLTFRCNPETGTQQSWNIPLIFGPDFLPADLHGQTLVVEGTLRDDADGTLRVLDVGGTLIMTDPNSEN